VRRYHEGWTSRNYGQATDLLAPTLEVEVPINDYPSAASFADALRSFGDQVTDVELLSEMSSGNEAMLLYDMQVRQLGPLRVVEHFTVADGKITRLRQIHDTAAIRGASAPHDGAGNPHAATEGDPVSAPVNSDRDFRRELVFAGPHERIFAALTTLDGLAGWWTPIVRGMPTPGGELEFGFTGLDETIVIRVDSATRPSSVAWTCLTHTGHPEWQGTRVVFQLAARDDQSGVLSFRHIGLSPTLSCFETCESGWDHFLASLINYAEHGKGSPF
jgi:uncharacterized protein YndB with AHSA1/START domain